jgi:SAM-dependent methyltransferase
MDAHDEVRAGFERWSVFEKARNANRMRHQEAYAALQHTLGESFARPPRLLDLGCGDARDMARLLRFVPVATYVGLDNDAQALKRAGDALGEAGVSGELVLAGYETAFKRESGSFDALWLGLFLHHLSHAGKVELLREAHRLIRVGGVLLAHDPVLREGETRQEYIERIEAACRSGWPELTPAEKDMLARHWGRHGRQESLSSLEALALDAGFGCMETLWRDPEEFYAVLAFWN